MATLREALDYASKNPNSDFAKSLSQRISTGAADKEAKETGIDLTPIKTSYAKQQQPVDKGGLFSDIGGDIKEIGTGIKSDIQSRLGKISDIKSKMQSGEKSDIAAIYETTGQLAGGISDVIGQGFKGAVKAVLPRRAEEKVKEVITNFGEDVAQRPEVQKLAQWYGNLPDNTKDALDATGGFISLATDVLGFGVGKKAVKTGAEAVETGLKKTGEAIGDVAKGAANIAGDIVPSAQRVSSSQLAKALNLTQGDLKNIVNSTGNEAGEWITKNNLIKNSVEDTQKAIDDLFDTQYKAVREAINEVGKFYPESEVPRFKQALETIQKQIDEVPGLEDLANEVDNLLKKGLIDLNDVQRAKELVDDTFDLYKVTGDEAAGRAKEGIRNIREELRKFIETEVKDATGKDIFALNNDVATAKSLSKAITARSTRGLTRANLSVSDLGTFAGAMAATGPVGAILAVLGKKAVESPAIRLRVAKFFDKLSDAKKAKVLDDVEKGVIPDEIKQLESGFNSPTVGQTVSVVNAFNKSKFVKKINKFELGTFGKNAYTRKLNQKDRFPISELEQTYENITKAFKSGNEKSYRKDNIAWIAEMPNNEKRVIYTRLNENGNEEIINWHKITNNDFIKNLEKFGVPTRNRTSIINLED